MKVFLKIFFFLVFKTSVFCQEEYFDSDLILKNQIKSAELELTIFQPNKTKSIDNVFYEFNSKGQLEKEINKDFNNRIISIDKYFYDSTCSKISKSESSYFDGIELGIVFNTENHYDENCNVKLIEFSQNGKLQTIWEYRYENNKEVYWGIKVDNNIKEETFYEYPNRKTVISTTFQSSNLFVKKFIQEFDENQILIKSEQFDEKDSLIHSSNFKYNLKNEKIISELVYDNQNKLTSKTKNRYYKNGLLKKEIRYSINPNGKYRKVSKAIYLYQ